MAYFWGPNRGSGARNTRGDLIPDSKNHGRKSKFLSEEEYYKQQTYGRNGYNSQNPGVITKQSENVQTNYDLFGHEGNGKNTNDRNGMNNQNENDREGSGVTWAAEEAKVKHYAPSNMDTSIVDTENSGGGGDLQYDRASQRPRPMQYRQDQRAQTGHFQRGERPQSQLGEGWIGSEEYMPEEGDRRRQFHDVDNIGQRDHMGEFLGDQAGMIQRDGSPRQQEKHEEVPLKQRGHIDEQDHVVTDPRAKELRKYEETGHGVKTKYHMEDVRRSAPEHALANQYVRNSALYEKPRSFQSYGGEFLPGRSSYNPRDNIAAGGEIEPVLDKDEEKALMAQHHYDRKLNYERGFENTHAKERTSITRDIGHGKRKFNLPNDVDSPRASWAKDNMINAGPLVGEGAPKEQPRGKKFVDFDENHQFDTAQGGDLAYNEYGMPRVIGQGKRHEISPQDHYKKGQLHRYDNKETDIKFVDDPTERFGPVGLPRFLGHGKLKNTEGKRDDCLDRNALTPRRTVEDAAHGRKYIGLASGKIFSEENPHNFESNTRGSIMLPGKITGDQMGDFYNHHHEKRKSYNDHYQEGNSIFGPKSPEKAVGRTHIRPVDHLNDEIFTFNDQGMTGGYAGYRGNTEVLSNQFTPADAIKNDILVLAERDAGLKCYDEKKWSEVEVKPNGKTWVISGISKNGKTISREGPDAASVASYLGALPLHELRLFGFRRARHGSPIPIRQLVDKKIWSRTMMSDGTHEAFGSIPCTGNQNPIPHEEWRGRKYIGTKDHFQSGQVLEVTTPDGGHCRNTAFHGGLERGIGHGKRHIETHTHMIDQGTSNTEMWDAVDRGHAKEYLSDERIGDLQRFIGHGKQHNISPRDHPITDFGGDHRFTQGFNNRR